MAELNLRTTSGLENAAKEEVDNNGQQQTLDSFPEQTSGGRDINIESASVANNTRGLAMEEISDPNAIKVTIADRQTPLVILFGPPSCGKTMTLVRLTRYLKNKEGYAVKPVSSFRPAYDKHYKDMCDNFDGMINSDDAAESTSSINFMLVQVSCHGRPLCQILEGPGEYYFNPDDPKAEFPGYVNTIKNSPNRKVWAIMVEPDSTSRSKMDNEARRNYADKVTQLKTLIPPHDKVLFVFNKIDETQFVIYPGSVRYGLLFQYTANMYPNIFVPFKNENPITRWFKPYNFDFIAFQTGDYTKNNNGTLVFQEGSDVYPHKLWDMILRCI